MIFGQIKENKIPNPYHQLIAISCFQNHLFLVLTSTGFSLFTQMSTSSTMKTPTRLLSSMMIIMMTALVCIGFLSTTSTVQAASFLSIFKSDSWKSIQETNQLLSMCRYYIPSISRNLATCTWYNKDSCCTVDTSQKIKDGWEKSSGRYSGTSNVTIPQFLVEAFAGGCLDELHQYSKFIC